MHQSRFTPQAQRTLRLAQTAATTLGHGYVGSEHLLLALSQDSISQSSKLLVSAGLTYTNIQTAIVRFTGVGTSDAQPFQGLTPRCHRIIRLAMTHATKSNCQQVATEHLFLGILDEGTGIAIRVLTGAGLEPQRLRQQLSSHTTSPNHQRSTKVKMEPNFTETGDSKLLEQFSTDLTRQAAAGKLDPVVGRDKEIQRVLQILSRRQKNNPALIGEPGVGKTAIAEGLARAIISGDVPEELSQKRILSLDLSSMVAGTKYRGEFEDRVKNVLAEVRKAGNIILFLDELHTIVGAGSAEGAIDAANIIKPALSRSDLQVIGATTLDEYRKYIEKDAALERRFQSVLVHEPSQDDTLVILKGLRNRYETHHKLTISDEALEAAVHLSCRYLTDRFLPDKAIDLMDEACSRVRLAHLPIPPELEVLDAKVRKATREKEDAIQAQDFERAALLRDAETHFRDDLHQQRIHWYDTHTNMPVDGHAITCVVSEMTGIPMTTLTQAESDRLLDLERELHQRVVGQVDAVKAVSLAVRRGRVGLKDPVRPTGSFLFLGPTGVGKTELCKALAHSLFGSEKALLRFDMSEYMERQNISRLIGSPPGYVGYDEGGQLTEQVRRHPYSVVLFDEIEKAHPDVWGLLLQILEDGILTDTQGRKINFGNTIIIMTSNIGATKITARGSSLGFSGVDRDTDGTRPLAELRSAVMDDLKKVFRPELLNRIDDIIVFRQLNRGENRVICQQMLDKVISRLDDLGIAMDYSDEVLDFLVHEGFDPSYGARPLRRVIQSKVEDPIAEHLLSCKLSQGEVVRLDIQDGVLQTICNTPPQAVVCEPQLQLKENSQL